MGDDGLLGCGHEGRFATRFLKNFMFLSVASVVVMDVTRVLACQVDLLLSCSNLGLGEFLLVDKLWLNICCCNHRRGVWKIF